MAPSIMQTSIKEITGLEIIELRAKNCTSYGIEKIKRATPIKLKTGFRLDFKLISHMASDFGSWRSPCLWLNCSCGSLPNCITQTSLQALTHTHTKKPLNCNYTYTYIRKWKQFKKMGIRNTRAIERHGLVEKLWTTLSVKHNPPTTQILPWLIIDLHQLSHQCSVASFQIPILCGKLWGRMEEMQNSMNSQCKIQELLLSCSCSQAPASWTRMNK